MNGSEFNPWLEAGLRHDLTAAEQAQVRAYIEAHPDRAASVEEDLGLNRLLRQLPGKPVPTNFTSQVLAAVARESRPQHPMAWLGGWRRFDTRGWMPKSALAGLVLILGAVSYLEYQHHARVVLARSVTKVSGVATLVSLDVLRDFEAINRLSQVPIKVDNDLLEALK